MLKLYYFPNLVSLATHVVLEEIGAPYEIVLVDLLKGEHKKPDYLAKNPVGQMPTLEIEDGVYLTETVAILAYLATAYPDADLAPTEPVARARWLAVMARIASGMHPTFTRVVRPAMVVEDEAAFHAVSLSARKKYLENLGEIDARIGDGPWIMGDQYTTADAHALAIYNWAVRGQFPVEDFRNYTRWKDGMIARPAVRTVLAQEGSALVPSA